MSGDKKYLAFSVSAEEGCSALLLQLCCRPSFSPAGCLVFLWLFLRVGLSQFGGKWLGVMAFLSWRYLWMAPDVICFMFMFCFLGSSYCVLLLLWVVVGCASCSIFDLCDCLSLLFGAAASGGYFPPAMWCFLLVLVYADPSCSRPAFSFPVIWSLQKPRFLILGFVWLGWFLARLSNSVQPFSSWQAMVVFWSQAVGSSPFFSCSHLFSLFSSDSAPRPELLLISFGPLSPAQFWSAQERLVFPAGRAPGPGPFPGLLASSSPARRVPSSWASKPIRLVAGWTFFFSGPYLGLGPSFGPFSFLDFFPLLCNVIFGRFGSYPPPCTICSSVIYR